MKQLIKSIKKRNNAKHRKPSKKLRHTAYATDAQRFRFNHEFLNPKMAPLDAEIVIQEDYERKPPQNNHFRELRSSESDSKYIERIKMLSISLTPIFEIIQDLQTEYTTWGEN